ncbi:MAG: DUF2442 domain-containing protein [Bacteroidota bacterium]|nr:DUF2442 domain-containing protein [Bacteroidota bacterium]
MNSNLIEINKAQYLNNYKIELLFNDGKKLIIDLKEFLNRAKNPITRKYINKNNFKNFKVEYGDLVWGDYEMCFPIWDLYKGKIF